MLEMAVPWWELVIRATVVYTLLLVGLRLGGRRQISQLQPFDFVLLLILSNAVQNSMNAGDNSLVGGLVSAATLLVLNFLAGWISARSRVIESVLDGEPEMLIVKGKLNQALLRRQNISLAELESAARHQGKASLKEIDYAVLEANGGISILDRVPADVKS